MRLVASLSVSFLRWSGRLRSPLSFLGMNSLWGFSCKPIHFDSLSLLWRSSFGLGWCSIVREYLNVVIVGYREKDLRSLNWFGENINEKTPLWYLDTQRWPYLSVSSSSRRPSSINPLTIFPSTHNRSCDHAGFRGTESAIQITCSERRRLYGRIHWFGDSGEGCVDDNEIYRGLR